MRAILIASVAVAGALSAASPALAWKTARCAPDDQTLLGRSPAGTVVYRGSDDIFACRRGGRAIRIGSDPLHGWTHVRLAGGFAAIATQECDKYDGGCFLTRVSVWNLRRYDRSAHRLFGSDDGDDVYGDFLDMELCANGALALMLEVAANREVWITSRGRWHRVWASPALEAQFGRDEEFVWIAEGGRRAQGFPICAKRPR